MWCENSIRTLFRFLKIEIKIENLRFLKSKLKCWRLALFCNFKVLFHKKSLRSNTVFCNPGPFIILEPIPPFLLKASNLGIFLQMIQPLCCKYVAKFKYCSKKLLLKCLSQRVPQPRFWCWGWTCRVFLKNSSANTCLSENIFNPSKIVLLRYSSKVATTHI